MNPLKKIIPKSPFVKNVLTLMTGTTISQAIPIAISPILTRIYSPEDFGVLSMFIAITAIISSVVTGRYEFAIILPKDDKKAQSLLSLCIVISAFFSSVFFLIIFFFHDFIVEYFDNSEISFWLYFFPLVVFLMGVFNAFNYYLSREKRFTDIAQANILKSLSLVSGQLLFSLFKNGAFGLIIGRIFSALVTPLYILKKLQNQQTKIIFNRDDLKSVAKRYIDFPKFAMWAGLFNNLALYFNNLLIPIIYSTSVLGFFSLVFRVLGAPFTLISTSVGQVFFKEISDVKNNHQDAQKVIWKLAIKLFPISVLGFGVIFFISEYLFSFVFGQEWRVAGVYAKYLIPMFILKFVVSPLTNVHSVYEKQKLSLLLQLLMFFLSLISIAIVYFLHLSFIHFLILYSSFLSVFYVFRFIIILKISKK